MRITAKKNDGVAVGNVDECARFIGFAVCSKKFFRAPLLKGEQNRTKAE